MFLFTMDNFCLLVLASAGSLLLDLCKCAKMAVDLRIAGHVGNNFDDEGLVQTC